MDDRNDPKNQRATEATVMKMGDGGFRLAFNVQFATPYGEKIETSFKRRHYWDLNRAALPNLRRSSANPLTAYVRRPLDRIGVRLALLRLFAEELVEFLLGESEQIEVHAQRVQCPQLFGE